MGENAIQHLSVAEGWTTPADRPDDALAAWRHSWPSLVALHEGTVIGYSRGLSDGAVTTYIAEVLVAPDVEQSSATGGSLSSSGRLRHALHVVIGVCHGGTGARWQRIA